MRSTRAFLIGLGTAYFFDPSQGKRRRALLRDRAAALARRTARVGERKLRFTGGHLRGLVAVSRRLVSGSERPGDDVTVAQRIRSDALRDVGVSTRDVDIDVQGGVATLRGEVASRSLADDLVARVRKVPGVHEVSDLIRVSSS